MYKVYILKSKTHDRYYIGHSFDTDKRLFDHNKGKVRSTKAYKPYELVYQEQLNSKTEARTRENFLKSGKGREYLKALLN